MNTKNKYYFVSKKKFNVLYKINCSFKDFKYFI